MSAAGIDQKYKHKKEEVPFFRQVEGDWLDFRDILKRTTGLYS
jgi:hypothetical protein